jgi:hypothetical protein
VVLVAVVVVVVLMAEVVVVVLMAVVVVVLVVDVLVEVDELLLLLLGFVPYLVRWSTSCVYESFGVVVEMLSLSYQW